LSWATHGQELIQLLSATFAPGLKYASASR